MIKEEDVYKIGLMGKPHGINGEITFLFDDDVFDRVDADYLLLKKDGILVPFFIEEYQIHSNENAFVKLEDIESQEQAKELTGSEVYFPRSLSDSEKECVSWVEIIGYQLYDTKKHLVGTIQSVDDSTINTLFEIKTEKGKDVLIPASEDLINKVDIKNRKIIINLPEGLLDLEK